MDITVFFFGSKALCEHLDEHTVTLTTAGLMLVLIEMTIQYSFNHFNTASHTYIPEPFSIIKPTREARGPEGPER